MLTKCLFAAFLALPASLGAPPWDKVPEKWDQADAYRILQDSPWSPAHVRVDTKSTLRHTNRQSGLVTNEPSNAHDPNPVPGIEVSRSKPQAGIPVLWWSSRTLRLARQRLRQLSGGGSAALPLDAPSLPDYVLAIEGSEPQRIFRDAAEDLHDTVFLELLGGATLDLVDVRYIDATDDADARTEFHFPREIDNHAAIDPAAERVIFHCKAFAKMPRADRDNAISIRAEFRPRAMRVRGVPDL